MSNVELALGAVVDIASTDDVRNGTDKVLSALNGHPRAIYRPVASTATVTSTTIQPLQINLGGPPAGRIWDIRQLVVMGGLGGDQWSPILQNTTPGAGSSSSITLPAGASLAVLNIGILGANTLVNQASGTFAATNAGSVALPIAGEYISGFDINFFPNSVNATSTITVTNVAGGTMSYDIGTSTAAGGTDFSIRYPSPIPASSGVVAPTVNVPAITGGGAYTINVYGQVANSAGIAMTVANTPYGTMTLDFTMAPQGSNYNYTFNPPLIPANPQTSLVVTCPGNSFGAPYTMFTEALAPVSWYLSYTDSVSLVNLLEPGVQYLPSTFIPSSSKSIYVHYGEELVAIVGGMVLNQSVTAIARVAEYPDSVMEASRI